DYWPVILFNGNLKNAERDYVRGVINKLTLSHTKTI
ncbi:MAG: hypothetical protein ACI9FB_004211, partial [Candidatus Azotimanducaceae bacterium]